MKNTIESWNKIIYKLYKYVADKSRFILFNGISRHQFNKIIDKLYKYVADKSRFVLFNDISRPHQFN